MADLMNWRRDGIPFILQMRLTKLQLQAPGAKQFRRMGYEEVVMENTATLECLIIAWNGGRVDERPFLPTSGGLSYPRLRRPRVPSLTSETAAACPSLSGLFVECCIRKLW